MNYKQKVIEYCDWLLEKKNKGAYSENTVKNWIFGALESTKYAGIISMKEEDELLREKYQLI